MGYGDEKWSITKNGVSFDVYTSSFMSRDYTPVNAFDGDLESVWLTGKFLVHFFVLFVAVPLLSLQLVKMTIGLMVVC